MCDCVLFDKYLMLNTDIFRKSKYLKWYISIVTKEYSSEDYTEKHHIIPKSLGGDNSKSNIVKLPAKAHFVCHKLLVRMVTNGKDKKKMIHALNMLAKSHNQNQHRHRISSTEYERIRRMLSESMKGEHNPMFGKPAHNRNITHSEETRKKLSEANIKWNLENPNARKGIPKSEETKKKLKRPKTELEKKNMSIAAKLKPRQECAYCGLYVTTSNYTRWHGSKCKKAP